MPIVQCQGCAWLALRLRHTRTLVDADDGYRYGMYVPTTNPSGRIPESIVDTLPICFANKRHFYDELRSPQPDLGDVKKVIEKDYDCDQFTEWQPGYTPKDLLDMRLLEEQRKWQADESQKAEERHRETITEAIKAAKSNERSQWGSGIIAAASAIAAAFLGVAATLGAVWVAARINPSPQVTVPPAQIVFPPAPTPPDVPH